MPTRLIMMSKGEKKIYIWRNALIVAIATIGMLPMLLSAGGYYIGGDITHQLLPFVYETKRMLASGAPLWSWNTYFGDNFIGSYAYYTVFNPFTWLNCLFPYAYLGLGFTLILYLKFLLCGWVAQRYLMKMGFDARLSLIGCLLYTFSSWAITNLIYYFFLEPMILFPLLLIFIERFLHNERHACSGLALAVLAVVAVNYYFASVNLIAGMIYFFFRLWHLHRLGSDRLALTLRAAGCVALGIACASAVLIPVLLQLQGSPHESLNLDSSNLGMVADRLLWLVFPKAHDGRFYYLFLDSGWKSNAASIAVFGLLPALLIYTRKGHGWLKWMTATLVVIYATPLNGLFSLFTDCYYTRWAYALTLCLILCTLYYIKDHGLPGMKYAVIYCVIVGGAFMAFCGASIFWQHANGNPYAATRLAIDAALVAINAVALLLICRRRISQRRRYAAVLVAVTVCTSAQFLAYSLPSADGFSPFRPDMTETEYFKRGEDFRSDCDFSHRTSFTVLRTGGRPSSNFGLATNRPSTETYHSVQNSKIRKWIRTVSDPDSTRIFYPRRFVEPFEALMSVKDLVIVSDEPTDTCPDGTLTARDGLMNVFESAHYIPMGFAYDSYVLTDSVEALAILDRNKDIPMLLLSALAIDKADEDELKPYLRKATPGATLSLDSLVAARSATACDSFTGHTRGFDAHISLDSARVVFFSVLADAGFKAYIDGEPTKIHEANLGLSAVVVPAGSHRISFSYFTPGLKPGLLISAIALALLALLFYKKH